MLSFESSKYYRITFSLKSIVIPTTMNKTHLKYYHNSKSYKLFLIIYFFTLIGTISDLGITKSHKLALALVMPVSPALGWYPVLFPFSLKQGTLLLGVGPVLGPAPDLITRSFSTHFLEHEIRIICKYWQYWGYKYCINLYLVANISWR